MKIKSRFSNQCNSKLIPNNPRAGTYSIRKDIQGKPLDVQIQRLFARFFKSLVDNPFRPPFVVSTDTLAS